MPAPLLMAGIAAGTQVGSQLLNAALQSSQNKKIRQWNEKMYGIQRQDALADFAMQNEYNHPSSQMARLREAGLNPNLVYGNGTEQNAAPIRSADVKSYNPNTPQFDLGKVTDSSLSAYYDTQVKQATVDNLRTQNTVLENEANLKKIEALMKVVDTDQKKFNLEKDYELRSTTVEAVKWEMQKLLTDISKTEQETVNLKDANARANQSQPVQLQNLVLSGLETQMRTAKTEAEKREIEQKIKIMKSEEIIKMFDAELTKFGIRPGDKIGWRIAAKVLGSLGFKL
ncbi:MAG: DNA pilot protein [Arizlama microvirus]|nr:MAG: DNA pilot protein [Arizlama microvirus]